MIVVSLTSFGDRIATTHIAVESILKGNLKPDLIVVYLPIEDKDKSVERLKQCDRTIIKYVEDFKSYKKYLGLIDYPNDIVVLADDDLDYRLYWLQKLVDIYEKEKDSKSPFIVAHRCQNLMSNDYRHKPFICKDNYKYCGDFVFGSGSGVLFPPNTIEITYDDIREGLEVSPHCDETYFSALCLIRKVKMFCTGFPQPFQLIKLPKDCLTLWSEYNSKEKDETYVKVFTHFNLTPFKNVVICLTSWKGRINQVQHTLDLIMEQTYKIKEIVLVLSREEFDEDEIPTFDCPLLRILWVDENFYTYKKFLPILNGNDDDLYLVIDDDVEYPSNFVEMMILSYDGLNPVTGSWLRTDYCSYGVITSCNGAFTLFRKKHLKGLDEIARFCFGKADCFSSDPLATYCALENGYRFTKSLVNYQDLQRRSKNNTDGFSNGEVGKERNRLAHKLLVEFILRKKNNR